MDNMKEVCPERSKANEGLKLLYCVNSIPIPPPIKCAQIR